MPRLYPPEFRQRAPGLVRSGRPVPGVATLLGIAVSWLVEQARSMSPSRRYEVSFCDR